MRAGGNKPHIFDEDALTSCGHNRSFAQRFQLVDQAMFDSNPPNHPPDLVKCFFEYVHQQGALMRVLDALTQRTSYVYNEEGCWFPDPDDPDPYFHFEGVKFGLVDESAIVVISEAECWQYVRQVAKVYAAECDANAVAVARMLARIVG